LRPVKDQINLITALHILKKNGFSFKLKLAGGFVDEKYYKQIVNTINSFGLIDKIEFLGEVKDVSGLLFTADIGVISSESEGLPVALLEYGLAGLPVICTDTGQCKEVLGNGSFGMVVPPQNPAALATAIMEMINNKPQAIKMGAAFNKVVAEQYGSGTFLKAYLGLINNID
jgi:glycosyltransferase involved in cell wall biosynthesis